VNPSPDALGFDLGRIAFQENRGQWPASICFIARSRNIVARVEKSGLAFELRTGETNSEIDGVLVRMTIEGQDRTVSVGERELPGKHHYCLGSNSNWVRGVRTFARVRMPCVRDGVDWLLREHEGAFEYDLELAAGADLDTLTIHCQGQDGLSIEEDGSLWLHTPAGVMRQRPPVSCERLESGEWRSVEVRFQKLGDDRFGFVAPGRDPSRALHIDPGIEWATYLGGLNSTSEQVRFVKRDASGDIVVAGETAAADFPVTPGAFTTASLAGDSIFIAKFNSSGGLVFSSHIAPVVQYCEVRALALDSLGRATVCGEFWPQVPNPSFPTTPQAFDTVINTQTASGYVLRLSAQGDALVFSTLLQCPPWGCVPYGLDVAPSGATVVGGMVNWPTYPTTPGAYDTTFDTTNGTGIPEGFVTRIAPDGSHLEWSTLLGGSNSDWVRLVALDALENVTVVGVTGSNNFPFTPGALNATQSLAAKCFVTRLNSQGSNLLWSANAIGPSGINELELNGLALGQDGCVCVSSKTKGVYTTTPGAFLPFPTNPVNDYIGYVFRLDATGSNLMYATYLTNYAWAMDLSVDVSGVATIAVIDGRSTMPITPGAPPGSGVTDGADAMILRLNPIGTKAYYAGRFGGPAGDGATCVTALDDHRVAVGGSAQTGFPVTSGAFDTTFNGGGSDGFVATVELVLQGVQVLGTSTPACLGSIGMNTTQMPATGSSTFGFWCSGAPPNSTGWLILGQPATQPTFRQGAAIWLDPARPIRIRAITTDALGFVETPLSLSGLPAGVTFAAQLVFRNTAACQGAGSFSASNALRIQTQ